MTPEVDYETNADIKFVIDATGSMTHLLDMVKANAENFHPGLVAALAKKHRVVDKLRVQVIVFRDLLQDDPEDALIESPFFSLPAQDDEFKAFLDGVRPFGGGDPPETSLEAVAQAMAGDWVKEGAKRRHIIMLFTDAPCKPLDGASAKVLPGLPASPTEFKQWWNDPQAGKMDGSAKRLIMFVPDDPSWKPFDEGVFDECIVTHTALDEGLADVDLETIYATICASI